MKSYNKIRVMEKNNETLKVLRVRQTSHQIAKINAAKKGIKIQEYIERLIKADEEGKINWE